MRQARLVELQLHSDWVSQCTYVESLRALVSASLDCTLKVTQLEWPSADVLSRAGVAREQCRHVCTLRGHSAWIVALALHYGSKFVADQKAEGSASSGTGFDLLDDLVDEWE